MGVYDFDLESYIEYCGILGWGFRNASVRKSIGHRCALAPTIGLGVILLPALFRAFSRSTSAVFALDYAGHPLPHGFGALDVHHVRVEHQPVHDGVCHGVVAELRAPSGGRELRA